MAEKTLPRLFKAYEDSIGTVLRSRVLQVIDKIIALLDNEMLSNFIEPYEFAKFLYGIFKTKDLTQTATCCQIVAKLVAEN
jgi:hypothetical protein